MEQNEIPEVTDFINNKVFYDSEGGYFLIDGNPTVTVLAEMRGFGAIQRMVDGVVAASEYQDKIGRWIADAINEKFEREHP